MRTRKTAASSADACRRCTALLPSGLATCALCGWPAGVGFPPAEGELVNAQAVAEPEVVDEPDHAQLDALAGIVARQAPASDEPADVATETPGPLDVDGPAVEAPDLEASEPEPVAEELDPLTAPLATLIDDVAHADSDDMTTDGETAELVDDEVAPPSAKNGRTFDVQRLAQVFIMGAALTNLALVGLEAVGGGAMVVVSLALVSLAIWTAATISFLYWVSRSYTRVAVTSPVHQRHGATMAVAGWMIPIAGFVIGYRVLQDLWAGSDPRTRGDADAAPAKARLIDLWLLGLVTATVFGYAMPLTLGDSVLWSALSSVGVLVAAFALIQVMSTIGAWTAEALATTATAVEPLSEHTETVDEGTVTTRVDDLQPTAPVAEQDAVSVD